MCAHDFQRKVMKIIADNTPKETEDNNLTDYKEREQIFYMLRALSFLPENKVATMF